MGIGTKSVYLGNDTTLDAKYGDAGTKSTNLTANILESDFDKYNNEVETVAITGGGYGSATAWAYLGRAFEVEDASGSQLATVTATVYMNGEMNTFNDGTNYQKVSLIVKDETDGEVYDEIIFEKGDYINNDIDRTITDSLNVKLEAGHVYGVQIKSVSEITVDADVEEASADFSRADDGDDRIEWESVQIKF